MTSEKLQDIALVTPGTSPRGDQINSDGNGLPFFQGSKEFGALYPTPERFTEFPVKVAKSGDILISVRAPVGEVNIAQEDCSIGRGVMAVHANNESERMFIYYLLRNLQGKWDSLGSSGSVFDNLSAVALKNIELPIGLKRQEIGEILYNIDQKIAINTAMSSKLESIAQSIFKSWFIDFDPVHAKSRGEKPIGMNDETAALFPDSFEDSELGMIPKGWNVRSIGDSVVKQKVGKLFDSKTSFTKGAVPVLDQGKSGVVGYHNEEPGVFASPDKPLVVFANHTCSLRLISYPFSVIQNVFPLIGKNVDVMWLYFAVEGKQMFDSYKGHWPDFVLHKIIHPADEMTRIFRSKVEPILQQKWLLEAESVSLANLRDVLLPKLISGELQIPEEMLVS